MYLQKSFISKFHYSNFLKVSLFLLIFFSLMSYQKIFASDDIESGNSDVTEEPVPSSQNRSNDDQPENVLIVSASKINSEVNSLVSPIEVVTSEEIKSSGKKNMYEVLAANPNLHVVRTGGLGGTSSVFIGGMPSNAHSFMIDGIKIYDPTQIGNTFQGGLMTTPGVRQVEVLRGTQSSLYGADAISGVINVVPESGFGKNEISVDAEFGSYGYAYQGVSINQSNDYFYGSFNISHFHMDGLSKAKGKDFSTDSDTSLNTLSKAGWAPNENFTFELMHVFSDSTVSIDDGVKADNPARENTETFNLFGLKFENFVNDYFTHSLKGAYSVNQREDDNRKNFDFMGELTDNAKTEFEGKRFFAEYNAIVSFLKYNSVLFGIDGEKVYYKNKDKENKLEKDVYSYSLFSKYEFNYKDVYAINAGGRYYYHEKAKEAFVWDVGGLATVPVTDTIIKASVATGFNAPSLYQNYAKSSFEGFPDPGNENLKPEKSVSYSAMIEQPFLKYFSTGLEYLKIDYSEKIDYSGDEYINTGGQVSSSYGIFFKATKDEDNYFKLSGTKIDAKNKETKKIPLRMPEYKISAVTNCEFKEFAFNLSYNYIGNRTDVYYIGWEGPFKAKLDPYHKVDANISYDYNENIDFYARFENILNQDYEEVYGYSAPGFSAFAGIRVEL